jgi:urease accessory protein
MKAIQKRFANLVMIGVGLLFTPAVFAHTFGAHGAGFADGLVHPCRGFDHLLAMLAIGLWAAQLGGASMWRLPLAFVTCMAVGAMLANPILDAGLIEWAVGGSVLALGLLLAFAVRLPVFLCMLAVGSFALFHGFAHGLEMPQAASPYDYSLGFIVATASLHLLGVILGLSLRRTSVLFRSGGAMIAAAGLLILAV